MNAMDSRPVGEQVAHPLEPLYDARSRVLVLGTMPSPVSRARAFYYANPTNRFWPVMARLAGVPLPQSNEERSALALDNRIALWDVLRSCRIVGASDAAIRDPEPNDIAGLLRASGIDRVFTTGAAACRLYNKLCLPLCGVEACPLPSTSAANARWTLDMLAREYAAIFR